QQQVDRSRQRPEAVAQLTTQAFERLPVGRLRQFSVNVNSLARIGDVSKRNVGARFVNGSLSLVTRKNIGRRRIEAWRVLSWIQCQEIDPNLHLHARFDLVPFKRADALLEQLAVELEADRRDVPALLRAEQIAGAANFQVAHRDFEAAAQRGVLLDGADALA